MISKLTAIVMMMVSSMLFGFPQLSTQDIAIQTELTKKINEKPNDVDLRFELAMAYASTGWIELGWDQLKLVPQLEKNYAETVFKHYSEQLTHSPDNWMFHFKLAFSHYFLDLE